MVVQRNVSRYDQRFVGFGWNKVSAHYGITSSGVSHSLSLPKQICNSTLTCAYSNVLHIMWIPTGKALKCHSGGTWWCMHVKHIIVCLSVWLPVLFLLFFCLSDGPSACCPFCLLQHSLPVTLSVCLCVCCFICSTIVCILSFLSVYGPWLSCMSFWPVVSLLSFLFDHGLSTCNFTFVWPPMQCWK